MDRYISFGLRTYLIPPDRPNCPRQSRKLGWTCLHANLDRVEGLPRVTTEDRSKGRGRDILGNGTGIGNAFTRHCELFFRGREAGDWKDEVWRTKEMEVKSCCLVLSQNVDKCRRAMAL